MDIFFYLKLLLNSNICVILLKERFQAYPFSLRTSADPCSRGAAVCQNQLGLQDTGETTAAGKRDEVGRVS